jgi:hypothetical protein
MEGLRGRKFDILNVYALKKNLNRCRLKEELLEMSKKLLINNHY